MNIIGKPEAKNIKFQQVKQQKREEVSPGPGSYDIALPIIKPNYEAIRKSNDVVILKVNHHGDSCNFRSQLQRFPNQKQKSPGPARYEQNVNNLPQRKVSHKKHSQRYTDLIEFMYRDRPIPDYKVQYDNEYNKSLRRIKNSHRRYMQKLEQSGNEHNTSLERKSSVFSKDIIINIQSKARLAESVISSSSRNTITQNVDQYLNAKQSTRYDQSRTIDLPQNSNKMKNTRRPLSLQKQQKLLLHRVTLYNRNMVGMLLAKSKDTRSRQPSLLSLINSEKSNNVDEEKQAFATIDMG